MFLGPQWPQFFFFSLFRTLAAIPCIDPLCSDNYSSMLHFLGFSIAGNAVLEKSDLKPALKALKDRLMTKNVVCVWSSMFG